jgi:hypothetical protein
MFEQVCYVIPHNITMVLAAVNTLKGHVEATWYITAVLGSHIPWGWYWTDTQIVAWWYDEDCQIL